MVRLHFEAAPAVEGERSLGRLTGRYRQLIVLLTKVCMDLIGGITHHVQDHLLAHPYVDLVPFGTVLPPAISMLMVSAYSALSDGDCAGTEVGDVAGEDDSLGPLRFAAGLAGASGSGLLVQPLSSRPRATAPSITALLAGMLVSLSLNPWVLVAPPRPRTSRRPPSCHDPSFLHEARHDGVPCEGATHLADWYLADWPWLRR